MFKRLTLVAANMIERRFQQNEIISKRYQIISHLGVGSYGNSYLVFDQVSQQKKVLKALRIHKRITRSGKAGFELEKNILKTIRASWISTLLRGWNIQKYSILHNGVY